MVLDLHSQGYTHREIEAKLNISRSTVSNDLIYLRKQAQDNLQHHIHEVIPEYHPKCLWGMKRILKQTLEIGEQSADPSICKAELISKPLLLEHKRSNHSY